MKVLVVSDSHGDVHNMERAVERTQPNMILHLGDGWHDAECLGEEYPEIPLVQVVGNCDFRLRGKTEQVLELEGKRIHLCHGHTYGVRSSLYEAAEAAEQEGWDAFLFGHTHKALVDKRGKVLFMNPGSIGTNYPPSYGVLTLENGKLDASVYQLIFEKTAVSRPR